LAVLRLGETWVSVNFINKLRKIPLTGHVFSIFS
jgi:hypothetical protein